MTTAEAAKIAGRRLTTIRHWIKTGRLTAGTAPSPKPPWEVFDITPEDLAAAIAAQRKPGRPNKEPSHERPEPDRDERADPAQLPV